MVQINLKEYLNNRFMYNINESDTNTLNKVINESRVTFGDLYDWYAQNTKSNGRYKADKRTKFHSCGAFVYDMLIDTDNECIFIDTVQYNNYCLTVDEAIKIVLDKYKYNQIKDFNLINVYRKSNKTVLSIDSISRLDSQIDMGRYEMLKAMSYTRYDFDDDKNEELIEFVTNRIKKLIK